MYEHGDRFPILDLIASFAFKSPGSVSIDLGTESDTLFLSDRETMTIGPGGVFNVIGWVDVHHPCEGHIKARIRVLLPARYQTTEQMGEFVVQLFSALGFPEDETYEASFVSADHQKGIVQATDRDGLTDRLYSGDGPDH
jgi:hypothetical protein